jgi:hypothetical protein
MREVVGEFELTSEERWQRDLLTVYFSNHEPDAIGSLFMGLLARCSILVVENGSCDGSERERTRLLNELAAGKLMPTQIGDPGAMFRGFEVEIGKAVYNTGRRIELENSPWSDEVGKKFQRYLNVPPKASSLDEALRGMQSRLDKAADLLRQRDREYAYQLSELVEANSPGRILAMMGSGHERAVGTYLGERRARFREVRQPSRLPSMFITIAVERTENHERLSKLDLLRCLAEFFPRPAFIPQGDRGDLLMHFWVEHSNEAQLREYLSTIYRG